MVIEILNGSFRSIGCHTPTSHENLDRSVLRPRLLLCLHGLGTNAGLQRMASLGSGVTTRDLTYVRHRYISVPALREAIANRREDHEISMLSLHLLQNCIVYVNTLMLQEVLAQPHWQGRLTETDLRALTPLTWEHINPYGRFELDMATRLPIK